MSFYQNYCDANIVIVRWAFDWYKSLMEKGMCWMLPWPLRSGWMTTLSSQTALGSLGILQGSNETFYLLTHYHNMTSTIVEQPGLELSPTKLVFRFSRFTLLSLNVCKIWNNYMKFPSLLAKRVHMCWLQKIVSCKWHCHIKGYFILAWL